MGGEALSPPCRHSGIQAVGGSPTSHMWRSFWNQDLARRHEKRGHTESHKRFLGTKPGSHALHFHPHTKGQNSKSHLTRLSEQLTSLCHTGGCDVKMETEAWALAFVLLWAKSGGFVTMCEHCNIRQWIQRGFFLHIRVIKWSWSLD